MIVDRDELKKNSKAKLGIPDQPHMRILRQYKPSVMQKRARIMSNIIGVLLALSLAGGAVYLVYTLFAVGSNIAERKIAELEAKENAPPAQAAPTGSDVQIIFAPSSDAEKK